MIDITRFKDFLYSKGRKTEEGLTQITVFDKNDNIVHHFQTHNPTNKNIEKIINDWINKDKLHVECEDKKYISHKLYEIFCLKLNIDKPNGLDNLVEWIYNEISDTSNGDFSNENISISFRRYVEYSIEQLL